MNTDGDSIAISEFPNINNSISVALQAFQLGIERDLRICFPACIYSYDRYTHKAKVMPLVKAAYFDGKYHYKRRDLIEVSVRNIQCGGINIDFPLYVGDTGWVFSSDRDTTLIKQLGALTTSVLEKDRAIKVVEDDYQAQPNQPILHSFENGFFIPDSWGLWESGRYKDSRRSSLANAVYIGSAFDTSENRQNTSSKTFQDGNGYELSPSASLVVNKGMACLASGSATKKTNASSGSLEDIPQKRCEVFVSEGHISINSEDDGETYDTATRIDVRPTAIALSSANHSLHASLTATLSSDGIKMMVTDGTSSMRISLGPNGFDMVTSGKMNVKTNGEVNLLTEDKLKVRAAGGVSLSSGGNADVVVDGNASIKTTGKTSVSAIGEVEVNSAKNLQLNAGGVVNLNSSGAVNIASAKSLNVATKDAVNIVTAGDTNIMSKKKGAKISVTAKSKESSASIVMQGKDSSIVLATEKENSSASIVMKGKNSSIVLASEDKDSSASVVMKGENSSIALSTEADNSPISINAKSSSVSLAAGGSSLLLADDKASLSSGSITLSGSSIVLDSDDLNALGASIYLQDSKDGKSVLYS